jgi:hypothetical protein
VEPFLEVVPAMLAQVVKPVIELDELMGGDVFFAFAASALLLAHLTSLQLFVPLHIYNRKNGGSVCAFYAEIFTPG